MITQQVTLNTKSHLNAWIGSILVQEAAKYKADITLKKGTKEANLKSIMGLLLLKAKDKEKLILQAEGPDEQEAVTNLATLIETKLQLINQTDKQEVDKILKDNFDPQYQISLSEITTGIKTGTQKRMKKIKQKVRKSTDQLKDIQSKNFH